MSDLLARVEQKEIVGISPSMPYTQGRLFKTGENVIFAQNFIQPLPGELLLVPKLASTKVLGIREHQLIDGMKQLFWGSPDSYYRWNASVGTTARASGLSGISVQTPTDEVSMVSFVPWGDWMLASNGVDEVMIDKNLDSPDPNAGFVAITDATFTYAKIIEAMGPYLVAFNTSNGARLAEWSGEDTPENFTISNDSAAGYINFREMESSIVATEWLGSVMGVYGTDSIFGMSLVGGDEIFRSKKLLSGIGVVGRQAVCAVGAINYGIGPRGIWQTDGSQFQYFDDPEVHDVIYENANLDQMSNAVVWYDKLFDQVVFWWPASGETKNTQALVYSRRGQNFTKWAFGRSAASESSIFQYGITGTDTGEIYGQSVVGAPSGIQGSPVLLSAQATVQCGYGYGGYGYLGYGGSVVVDG